MSKENPPALGRGTNPDDIHKRGESMTGNKRAIIILAGALMLAGLAGCGNSAAPAGSDTAAGALNADYENALPVESQLILGTLLLEDTELAVTDEQAAELLPLWQMMKELNTSGTAATQEKGGLILQIEAAMAPEQIQAIADKKLTQQDVFAYMQEAGMGGMPQLSGTPASPGDGGNAFPGGMAGEGGGGFVVEGDGPPAGFAGGMPGGGPGAGPNSGQDLTSEQIATMEARRASRGTGGNSYVLLDTLLELLDSKQTP